MSQQPIPLAYAASDYGGLAIRDIAKYQRGLIMCILAYIVFAVAAMALKGSPLALLCAFMGFASSITGAVFVFILAIKLYGVALGIIMGILTLIPLIGLITLLIVNGKATGILKKHNVPVGFLGANMSNMP
jgi:hypothetical protein